MFLLPDSGQTRAPQFPRYVDGFTPTEEIPAVDDPSMMREYSSGESPALRRSPFPPETPVVSEARRNAGRSIAVALLVVLVLGAVWFIYSTTSKP